MCVFVWFASDCVFWVWFIFMCWCLCQCLYVCVFVCLNLFLLVFSMCVFVCVFLLCFSGCVCVCFVAYLCLCVCTHVYCMRQFVLVPLITCWFDACIHTLSFLIIHTNVSLYECDFVFTFPMLFLHGCVLCLIWYVCMFVRSIVFWICVFDCRGSCFVFVCVAVVRLYVCVFMHDFVCASSCVYILCVLLSCPCVCKSLCMCVTFHTLCFFKLFVWMYCICVCMFVLVFRFYVCMHVSALF